MTTEAVTYELKDGIAHLVLDDPSQSANTMNQAYTDSMEKAVDAFRDDIASQGDAVKGAVVSSAKKTFFAGGDLKLMTQATTDDAPELFANVERVKATLRKLETSGKPVVAAINGAALGGGLEIALACHHRVAADGRYEIGLPEASLGLLPGGGGVTRTVRMFGIADALMKVLLQGPRLKPAKAQGLGLVDEVVAPDDLLSTAVAWVEANAGNEEAAQQPWDRQGYKMPGGKPTTPSLAAILPSFPSNLRKQVKGADYRAQRNIMSAAVEGALVDFDTASRIESRYLVELIVGQQFKNMTQAFFFDLGAINAGKSRPDGIEPTRAEKVAVLGAGMMGAGIAYVSAQAGMQVVLKDISQEAADKGKAYSEKLLDKALERGRITAEKKDEVLGRILATADYADLEGCDFVVEAVFESVKLKHEVFAEVEKVVKPDALLGSNTSTLPITGLAEGVSRPKDFIGIHFFSPVDKMLLVEIIKGKETGPVAVAKALDFVRQIRKTPIVVNDERFFYANRCIIPYINEGIRMVAEGVNPTLVENAAKMMGMPLGPLQLVDETSIDLGVKIAKATKAAMGDAYPDGAVDDVLFWMADQDRMGRKGGAGFYAYEDGKRQGLWEGLDAQYPRADDQPALEDIQHRLMFAQSLEAVRALEDGVLEDIREGDVGAILGWGFAPWSGGPFGWLDILGAQKAVEICDRLEGQHGPRFKAPQMLRDMAAKGDSFYGRKAAA